MIHHDPRLLERLDALPRQPFDGDVFRATRQQLDPRAASYNGGRWMVRDAVAVLYTSLERDGALAEIAFHWSQLTPRPTKSVQVHRLHVATRRTLRLLRADVAALGVGEAEYTGITLPATQAIGAAIAHLGCDGLIAPSARWHCDNLMLFTERLADDAAIVVSSSETVDWLAWATAHGVVGPG